jgi:uncharacterized cupredoxin-like copper-binding protein
MNTLISRPSLAAILVGLAAIPVVASSDAVAASQDAMAPMEMGGSVHHDHSDTTRFDFGAPAPGAKAARTVKIIMADVMFEPAAVVVRSGETVRFAVTNTSSVDHEFTLGGAPTEAAHRKEMAEMMARGADMAHDDPNAITVKPGQTRDLTWTFGRAERLEFDCDIPGHYESGMKGTIIVR